MRRIPLPVKGVLVLIALAFALVLEGNWDLQLRFAWAASYGLEDPLFGLDLGFHLFTLPYLELIQNTILSASVIAVAVALWLYLLTGALHMGPGFELDGDPAARRHLAAHSP